jgi:hypothetical protein
MLSVVCAGFSMPSVICPGVSILSATVLSVSKPSVIYAKCQLCQVSFMSTSVVYAECQYAECHNAKLALLTSQQD